MVPPYFRLMTKILFSQSTTCKLEQKSTRLTSMDLEKDSKQASEKLKENGRFLTETEDKLLIKDKENKHMDTTLSILHGKELSTSISTISETPTLWML